MSSKNYFIGVSLLSSNAKSNTSLYLNKAKNLINNYTVVSTDGILKPCEAVIYEL